VSGREKPEDKSGGLSRVARRALETAADAAAGLPGDIAYQHTVWCQTSLPYRNPPAAVRVWEKRQGNVSLRVEAGAAQAPDRPEWIELPLPFGPKARLILCYLNAEAIRQQTPVIGVRDSLTAFVKRLGLAGNGRNITAVKCQLTALSAAVIRFGFLREHCSVTVKQDIVQGFDLWFPRDGRQRILWPSAVRLSGCPITTSTVSSGMPSRWTSGRWGRWHIRPWPWISTAGWRSGCTGFPKAAPSVSPGPPCSSSSGTGTGARTSSGRCSAWP
jgi:hypothetical protein